jgi:HAMP domain-containing protein
MHIEPALLSAMAALMGAVVGGGASLGAAIYTQRYQDRLQRIAREISRRETVYADFITHASKLLLKAQVRDEIKLGGDEQQLIGLTDRMRLFAPPHVIDEAEGVIRAIVEIWLQPSVEPRQLAEAALSNTRLPDPLLSFSLACRADLDSVHQTVV